MNKCPKCEKELEILEEDYESMSEAEQSDHDAGLWRTCYCPKCKTTDVIEGDFGMPFIPGEDDLIVDDLIDEDTFEDLIDRAIDNRCYIEVISLVHNVIESYLKFRIRVYMVKNNTGDKTQLENKSKTLDGRGKNNHLKYMDDYKEMCFILNLIDEEMFNKITKFNSLRNTAIHKLLRVEKQGRKHKYGEIVNAAKLGREIQLTLSPLSHPEEHIEKILERFNLEIEDSGDQFLSDCDLPYNEP